MHGASHSALVNLRDQERTVAPDQERACAVQATFPESFEDFYALYSRRLYKTIIAITKHPEDAEDALQETFLRAYLSFHTFEGRSTLYSWLSRIAINSALQTLRRRRTHPEILFDPHPDSKAETFWMEPRDPAPTPEQTFETRHHQVTLHRAIRKLDAKLRKPIQLRIAGELSVKEISQALNISDAAVKTRLHRARIRLSTAFEETRL